MEQDPVQQSLSSLFYPQACVLNFSLNYLFIELFEHFINLHILRT